MQSNRLGYPESALAAPLTFLKLRAQFARKMGTAYDQFIEAQPWDSTTKAIVKAAVGESDFSAAALGGAGGESVAPSLKTRSVLDFLLTRGAVRVGAHSKLLTSGDAVAAAAVANGGAIRVSAQSLAGVAMPPFKIGAISVASREALEDSTIDLAALAEINLAAGVDDKVNSYLLDGLDATDTRPASIVYGATDINSAGTSIANIATDRRAAFRELSDKGSDCQNLVIIGHPRTAGNLATMHTTDGSPAFPGMAPSGGILGGVPFIASAAVENGGSPTATELVVLDASDLAVVDEGTDTAFSDAGMIEMSDGPTGDTITPVAASALRVSLFQAHAVAIKTVRRCSWRMRRGLVVVVQNVAY